MTGDAIKPIDERSPKSRRRWFSFSLRSLMLLVVVIAIPLAWKVNRARNQRIVVAELEKLNAVRDGISKAILHITYDYEIVQVAGRKTYPNVPPPGPKWLVDFFGKEYLVEVSAVTIYNPQVTDATIALIARLPKIEYLTLGSPNITDDGLVHFAGMHNLETLELYSNNLTGADLVHLAGLKRFKKLTFSGRTTDVFLEQISKLNDLEFLQFFGTAQITDRGLAHIAKLHKLKSLRFEFKQVLAVGEDYVRITDEGLVNLHGLKNLEILILNTTQVTQTGIDDLQKALPIRKFSWNGSRVGPR